MNEPIHGPWAEVRVQPDLLLVRMRVVLVPDDSMYIQTQYCRSDEMVDAPQSRWSLPEPGSEWFPLDSRSKLHQFALTYLAKTMAQFDADLLALAVFDAVGGDMARFYAACGENGQAGVAKNQHDSIESFTASLRTPAGEA